MEGDHKLCYLAVLASQPNVNNDDLCTSHKTEVSMEGNHKLCYLTVLASQPSVNNDDFCNSH